MQRNTEGSIEPPTSIRPPKRLYRTPAKGPAKPQTESSIEPPFQAPLSKLCLSFVLLKTLVETHLCHPLSRCARLKTLLVETTESSFILLKVTWLRWLGHRDLSGVSALNQRPVATPIMRIHDTVPVGGFHTT